MQKTLSIAKWLVVAALLAFIGGALYQAYYSAYYEVGGKRVYFGTGGTMRYFGRGLPELRDERDVVVMKRNVFLTFHETGDLIFTASSAEKIPLTVDADGRELSIAASNEKIAFSIPADAETLTFRLTGGNSATIKNFTGNRDNLTGIALFVAAIVLLAVLLLWRWLKRFIESQLDAEVVAPTPLAKPKTANLIKGAAFCVVLLILYGFVNEILREKYAPFRGRTVPGFFAEPKNSMDVVFLGASNVKAQIIPSRLFKDFGITSYDFAQGASTAPLTYYYMREAIKRQPNAIYVADMMFYPGDGAGWTGYGVISWCFDQLPWSLNKLTAILERSHSKQWLMNMFPIIKFHTNWLRLNRNYLYYSFYGAKDPILGMELYFHKKDYQKLDAKLVNPSESASLSPAIERYLRKTLQYAKDHKVKFAMVTLTRASVDESVWKQYKRMKEIAEEYGVPYLNLNEKIGGEDHTSLPQSVKNTEIIGQWLHSQFDISDKRKDPQVSEYWEKPIEVFETQMNTYALKNEADFAKILTLLKNPNYTVMFSVRDSATRNPTDKTPVKPEIIEAWKNLGLNPDIFNVNRFQHSYLAIIDGDKVLLEGINNNPLNCKKFLPGIGRISMQSAGAAVGNYASIKIDNAENSPNQRGFNLVVYDKMLEQVVLNKSFDTIALAY